MGQKQQKLERLFRRVFGNIIIFKNIFEQVRIIKKNECIEFYSRKGLLEYKEREYISKIIFNGDGVEMLDVNDLPISGVLKEVEFGNYSVVSKYLVTIVKGFTIPFGVEKLVFISHNKYLETTPLSTFPSSIHTVEGFNAILSNDINESNYIIPPNITSISFYNSPNISGEDKGNGYMLIPNTIKKLRFRKWYNWNNEGIKFAEGDIPNSVTSLSITGYQQIYNISKGVLPNSIQKLRILYRNQTRDKINKFNFIPPSVTSLFIKCHSNITPESILFIHSSITKLKINFQDIFYSKFLSCRSKIRIEPNSLPSNITNLKLIKISSTIEEGTIPNSVTNLKILYGSWVLINPIPKNVISLTLNRIVTNPGILPPSLTNLDLANAYYEDKNDIIKMISILPHSLTQLALPEYFIKLKEVTFPDAIKKISYKK